jgi:hypothetical protein
VHDASTAKVHGETLSYCSCLLETCFNRFFNLVTSAENPKRLFLDGKIDGAIKLLNDEELRQSLAQAKKAIADIVQAWLLKAHLLTVQFRFDAAEEAYKSAIEAAPERLVAPRRRLQEARSPAGRH